MHCAQHLVFYSPPRLQQAVIVTDTITLLPIYYGALMVMLYMLLDIAYSRCENTFHMPRRAILRSEIRAAYIISRSAPATPAAIRHY
jgi:hypothetical protein